jgi:hypothetical protein
MSSYDEKASRGTFNENPYPDPGRVMQKSDSTYTTQRTEASAFLDSVREAARARGGHPRRLVVTAHGDRAPSLARPALLAAATTLLALAAAASAGDYKIIAHPSVPVATLSRATVSSYFLKKIERWPDGTPVAPVDQAPGSPLRQSFARQIHEKSVENLDAFWQRQVFSGRATPPPTKASDAEVIAYVRSAPGSIGYVSAGASTTGVKEIRLE